MTQKNEIYKCEICGNLVEVIHTGSGTLVCCGQDMVLIEAKTQDEGLEKHVPVIKKTSEGVLVKVGQTEHPMEDNHYIEWLELITHKELLRAQLKPGQKPEFLFKTDSDIIYAREHCNLHGLWKT